MTKLSESDAGFIKLVLRSPDLGSGWRQVSKPVWQLVEKFKSDELLEKDETNLRVRLSDKGLIVAGYLA